MNRPSGFTPAEACEYVRVQCGWTKAQLAPHRAEIAAAIRSGSSVVEVVAAMARAPVPACPS